MQIVIELPRMVYESIKDNHDGWNNYICTAIRNGTVLEDVLKDFLEWYTLPFNDSLFKHADEVIQEFMDYQKESTNAGSD